MSRELARWGGVLDWSPKEKNDVWHIDIEQTIVGQLVKLGMPASHISRIAMPEGDPAQWHTTRGLPENRRKRNLVLITAL